jgi:hypothetical protein
MTRKEILFPKSGRNLQGSTTQHHFQADAQILSKRQPQFAQFPKCKRTLRAVNTKIGRNRRFREPCRPDTTVLRKIAIGKAEAIATLRPGHLWHLQLRNQNRTL